MRAAVGAEASTYLRDGCGLHTALAVRVNERRVAPAPFGAPSGCPRTGAGPPAARPPAQGLDAWRRACPRPLCQKPGVHSMIIFTMSYAHWKRSSALETRIAKPADLRAPRLPLFALSSYTHCRAEGMATQRGCAGGHGVVGVVATLRDAPYLGAGGRWRRWTRPSQDESDSLCQPCTLSVATLRVVASMCVVCSP